MFAAAALSPARVARHLLPAILLLVPTAFAQPAAPHPLPITFEAATIKPTLNPPGKWRLQPTPDGYAGSGISLFKLVQEAYGIFDKSRVIGGPAWVDRDRFDLEAKFDPTEVPDAKKLSFRQHADMLQPLLADRFQLKVHHEKRVFPVFNLVVAKGGPKLQQSPPEHLHNYGMGLTCVHTLTGTEGCSAADIAFGLGYPAGRTVIDKTGLTVRYDYQLKWSSNPDSDDPSIFTAVEEQLGLKLEPSTAPLDVLIIDSAEKPSAN